VLGTSYKATVRALVPLVIASIAALVVVASAVGGARENLIIHLPVVAWAPGCSTDGVVTTVGNADSLTVKLSRSTAVLLLVLRYMTRILGNPTELQGREERRC
jgi:hypothetical protein